MMSRVAIWVSQLAECEGPLIGLTLYNKENEFLNVYYHIGPPGLSFEHVATVPYAWITSGRGGVSPHDELPLKSRGNIVKIKMILGEIEIWYGSVLEISWPVFLHECIQEASGRSNRFGTLIRELRWVDVFQEICYSVLGPWSITKSEVGPGQE